MELKEFKRQFRVRRQEAEQERDELCKKADDFLSKFSPLVELMELSVADFKARKLEAAVRRLKDQGFDNLAMLDEELHKLVDDSESLFTKLEKLEDELNRQRVTCPTCNGLGFTKGKSEWVESDTGRIQITKLDRCPLCKRKGRFTVDALLHC